MRSPETGTKGRAFLIQFVIHESMEETTGVKRVSHEPEGLRRVWKIWQQVRLC